MADYYGKDTNNTPKTISVTDPLTNAAVSAAIIDNYEMVLITLTGSGNTQTIQTPTDTATIRTVTFINNDTSTHSIPFVANSVTFTITPGEGQCFLWDGSAWGPTDLGITSIPVPVTQGGTGAATAQAAINTLTAVASATNEHVLTKDTATGNAIFKAIGSPTTWSSVSSANYTAAPASTSTITMTADLTGSILVGQSLKYTIGGVVYYGRVAIIAANLLTINGAPLSGNVSDLYFGGGTIRQAQIVIPGAYEDATNTALIASDLKSSLIWSLPKSYCVAFAVYSNTHDTGTHGQASVRINGTELCTTAGGLTIAADATWYASVVDIDVAAYDVNPGEAIEVTSVKAGNGDASDLTVKMIIVTP